MLADHSSLAVNVVPESSGYARKRTDLGGRAFIVRHSSTLPFLRKASAGQVKVHADRFTATLTVTYKMLPEPANTLCPSVDLAFLGGLNRSTRREVAELVAQQFPGRRLR
jgi:hypothetical protein